MSKGTKANERPIVWVHTRSFAYEGRWIHENDPESIWMEVHRPAGSTHHKTRPDQYYPARVQEIALPWSRIMLAETLDEKGRRVAIRRPSH